MPHTENEPEKINYWTSNPEPLSSHPTENEPVQIQIIKLHFKKQKLINTHAQQVRNENVQFEWNFMWTSCNFPSVWKWLNDHEPDKLDLENLYEITKIAERLIPVSEHESSGCTYNTIIGTLFIGILDITIIYIVKKHKQFLAS